VWPEDWQYGPAWALDGEMRPKVVTAVARRRSVFIGGRNF
jgi:hypothetical protein